MRKKSLAQRILSVLEKDPRREYNAPTIDRILCGEKQYIKKQRKEEVHKIRTELRRMVKKGIIRSEQKGFYSLMITARNLHLLENPPVTCHGLKIETKIKHWGATNSIGGVSSPRNKYLKENEKDDLVAWLMANGYVETTNNRFHRRFNWEGRWVTLTIHPLNGLIEVWVKSSNCPLTFTDLIRLREFLKGMLSELTDFNEAMVRQIGINKDFKDLRLEGVSCVSLRTFLNSWSRIYQHEHDMVRIEAHWVGSIDFDNVIMLIAKVNAPPVMEKNKSVFDDGGMFG